MIRACLVIRKSRVKIERGEYVISSDHVHACVSLIRRAPLTRGRFVEPARELVPVHRQRACGRQSGKCHRNRNRDSPTSSGPGRIEHFVVFNERRRVLTRFGQSSIFVAVVKHEKISVRFTDTDSRRLAPHVTPAPVYLLQTERIFASRGR